MSGVTVYEHFRYTNDDGSTKDWAIAAAPPGLHIRYCRTGSAARLSEVPSSRFAGRSADREMQVRIDKKLAKGYCKVGQANVVDNRLKPLSRVPWHDLHWEVVSSLEIGSLGNALSRIAKELSSLPGVSFEGQIAYHDSAVFERVEVVACEGEKGYRDPMDFEEIEDVASVGMNVNLPRRTWHFGQQTDGGLDRERRGGGRVSIHLGPVPFLILMALDREFPDKFRFANDEGEAVKLRIAEDDPFIGAINAPMAEIVKIAARLGLCLGPIQLSKSDDERTEPTLWF